MNNEFINRNLKTFRNGIALINADYSLIWCSDLLYEIFEDPSTELEKICRTYLGSDSASLADKKTGLLYEGDIFVGEYLFNAVFHYSGGENGVRAQITAVFSDKTEDDKRRRFYEKFLNNFILSMEAAKIVPWEYDTKSRIISNIFGVNMVFEGDVLKLPIDEWELMIHPDDLDAFRKGMDDVLKMRSSEFRAEYRIILKPGRIMWLKTIGRVTVHDEGGEPVVVSGINQDITEMKLLQEKSRLEEEKLRNSRTSLKNALNMGKLSPWEYDFTGGTFKTDQKMAELWGYPDYFLERKGITWELLSRNIHPDDREYAEKKMLEAITGLYGFNASFRILVNGVIRHIHFASEMVLGEDGKPNKLIGVAQDITELRLLKEKSRIEEENLRRSESRLKNAMKLGRLSPWEYDIAEETFTSDRQMAEIMGFLEYYETTGKVDRATLIEKIHPDDIDYVNAVFSETLKNFGTIDISYRIKVNGEIKHIHFVSETVFDHDGKPLKFMGVAQDITGIKKLEDSLARQFERLRFIAEKIGLGIWEMRVDTGIISVMNMSDYNSPASELRSFTVEELISLVHPDDRELFRRRLDKHLAGEEHVIELEVRIRSIEEKEQYSWYYITSVIGSSDPGAKAAEIRGFYQNITDRKEMEAKLYQSQKMEAIGRLAGGIAHDFNNILQVILGYGSLALMETDNDSELFQTISNIVDSGDKARTLIRQLLLFAREGTFNPSSISVNEVCRGLLTMLRRLIGENIALTFSPDENLENIHGDPGQIEQVFLNLCINSRDAVSGSGSIIISTRMITIDDYWPSFDNPIPPGNYVMISVSDTGCGIDQEHLGRIFEPFFTTKEKNSGTGLGLATVYSIVKQHKGYIDLFSITGKGTTFTIYLPPEEQARVQETPVKSQTDDSGGTESRLIGGETILLAEDDELVRKYTSRILTDSGYRVMTASDGAAAIDIFNRNRDVIDLVILDVVMPKVNGWDVYNMIGGAKSGVPVIFFSGYDRNLLPEDIASIPNMRFVQKPFKYYAIIKAVHELLD